MGAIRPLGTAETLTFALISSRNRRTLRSGTPLD
jgi:hypothetical protein